MIKKISTFFGVFITSLLLLLMPTNVLATHTDCSDPSTYLWGMITDRSRGSITVEFHNISGGAHTPECTGDIGIASTVINSGDPFTEIVDQTYFEGTTSTIGPLEVKTLAVEIPPCTMGVGWQMDAFFGELLNPYGPDFYDGRLIASERGQANCATPEPTALPTGTPAPTATPEATAPPTPPNPTPTSTGQPTVLSCAFDGPNTITLGQSGSFSSTTSGQVDSYTWLVDGGSPMSGVNSSFSWTPSSVGNYNVSLTVSGPSGEDACEADVAVVASGANFSLSLPSCAQVNNEVAVPLMVRTDDDAANLFSAKLSFNPAGLQVVRIDRNPTFVQNWVETTFDNSTGKISIIGAVPSPGFQTSGVNSQMATIVFKPTQAGITNVIFDSTSEIYRDSDNEQILASSVGGNLSASAVCAATPTPSPTSRPTPTSVPTATPVATSSARLSLLGQRCNAVGSEVPVRINARTDIYAANLFSAKISYPTNILDIVRFDKAGSFVTNWVEEVSNNSTGRASVVGGVPTPGFKTSNADALLDTVIFRVKAATASAAINLDSTSAVYRDSDNQNILAQRDSLTINTAGTCTPEPTPTSAPTPTPGPGATPTPPGGGPAIACSFSGPTTLVAGQTGNYQSTSTGSISTYFWSASGGLPNTGVNSTFNWSAGVAGNYTIALTVNGPAGQQTCNTTVGVSAPPGGGPQATNPPAGKIIPKGPPVTGRGK